MSVFKKAAEESKLNFKEFIGLIDLVEISKKVIGVSDILPLSPRAIPAGIAPVMQLNNFENWQKNRVKNSEMRDFNAPKF